MLPVPAAAAPILGTLALLLAGTGGSGAAGGQPELWQPPPDARWQYQLESANRGLGPSGGINVEICEAPRGGGACVRPDVFDIDREFGLTVWFGYGIHFCIGAALARMEARIAIEQWAKRWPRFTVDEAGCRRVTMSNVAGYANVPVSVG